MEDSTNREIDEEENDDKRITRSPSTFIEDWFREENIVEWPIVPEDLKIFDNSLDLSEMMSEQEICEDLSVHAALDIHEIDDLIAKIEAIEATLEPIANKFISKKKSRKPRKQHNEYFSPSVAKALGGGGTRRRGQGQIDPGIKYRSLEHSVFPGFSMIDHTALPSALEAQKVLFEVFKLQTIPTKFKKMWRHYFLSEFSIGIMQDAFWWFYLDLFQRKDAADNKTLLFGRISDNFVGLLFSLHTLIKDMFLKQFPDYLAQSIYMVYCQAFPRSYASFDDKFKTTLCSVLSEWINGVKVAPASWKDWRLESLESHDMQTIKDDMMSGAQGSLAFDFDALLVEEITAKPYAANTSLLDYTAILPSKPKVKRESHPMKPGRDNEHHRFNTCGNSPLVLHFLASRKLKSLDTSIAAQIVSRTEVAQSSESALTYRDFIEETESNLKESMLNQKRIQADNAQRLKQIESKRRQGEKNLQSFNKDFIYRKNEIKHLGEKICDKINHSMYNPRITPKRAVRKKP